MSRSRLRDRTARGLPVAAALLATLGSCLGAAEHLAPVACNDVVVSGSTAWLGRNDGLTALDVSRPGSPRTLSRMARRANVLAVEIDAARAYLALGPDGALVVDIGDPAHPTILTHFRAPASVTHVVHTNNHILLAESHGGLRVVDVSEADHPLSRRLISTRHKVRRLALRGERLATAEGDGGVRIFDVSRPARASETARLRSPVGARDVALTDTLLLVAAGRQGLLIYRLDDLDDDRPIAIIPAARSAHAVSVEGDLATVSNGSAGVQGIDLTDPAAPALLWTVKAQRNVPDGRTAVGQDRMFVCGGSAGLREVDLSQSPPKWLLPPRKRIEIRDPGRDAGGGW